ncbi:MAG: hypothetical protein OXI43_09405 [Candidatus Poribacteria bacterium]|nr:hypothetical protein [Candidatus Poribacteria bacterium]
MKEIRLAIFAVMLFGLLQFSGNKHEARTYCNYPHPPPHTIEWTDGWKPTEPEVPPISETPPPMTVPDINIPNERSEHLDRQQSVK